MATPNREYVIKFEMPSEIKLIYLLDSISNEVLKVMDFKEEDVEQVNLAIIEAGTNAIKHGNKNDPNKRVNFQFCLCEDKLTVIVNDQGEGFDTSQLPDPLDPENLLKSNGRGIFLMQICMNEVTFDENGSEVRMVKYK